MRTLYVTDLDGTLLRSDQKTSEYTNQTINELVNRGMLFSYATARAYSTSHKVTRGLTAAFPVIVYNGAFVRDNDTGNLLLKNFFKKRIATGLVRELMENNISPIVYAFLNGDEKFSYMGEKINSITRDFIDSRKGDRRNRPVADFEELIQGDIFYITCIDDSEKLSPFFNRYQKDYHCVYQTDIYSHEQWLEIMPKNASKAVAIEQLQKILECDRLVVFGDGINDIDMFQIADEAYAVENAVPELKKIATGIIASNDEDGVARWLHDNFNHQKNL